MTTIISGDDASRARSFSSLAGAISGSICACSLRQRLAEFRPFIAAHQQQPPRHEFAVIGHANGGAEQPVELFGGRTGFAQLQGGRGNALIQRGERIGVKLLHCHPSILAVARKLG